jgi:hypothetical protein
VTSTEFLTRCLPGDVDVLTDAGWRRGVDLRDGDRIAVWDPDDAAITLEPAGGIETGPYDGNVISLTGAIASTTGNPDRGIWVRTPVSGDDSTWSRWHVRRHDELSALGGLRIAVAGYHSGPGLRNDAGDYAGVLGWISVEEGYHGTSIRIAYTESNHHRATATSARLAALGASLKRTQGHHGVGVDAWFLPGPLTAAIHRELAGGLPSWAATWNMSSVELRTFMDGAAGGRRNTIHRLDPETVDLIQAVAAMSGHRTIGHDVGRRAGASIDLSAGVEAPVSRDRVKRRIDTWSGPAFAVTTRTGAVVARRGWRVFVAAT